MPADRYTQKTFVHAVLAGGGGAALDAAMSKTIFPTARLLLRSWKPSSTPAAENGSSRKMTAFTVAPVAAGASTSEARYSRSAVLTLVRNRCSFFLPEREGEESGVRGEGERGRETVRDTRRGMARLLYTCMCCANASMCVTVCVHVRVYVCERAYRCVTLILYTHTYRRFTLILTALHVGVQIRMCISPLTPAGEEAQPHAQCAVDGHILSAGLFEAL